MIIMFRLQRVQVLLVVVFQKRPRFPDGLLHQRLQILAGLVGALRLEREVFNNLIHLI